MPYLETSAKLGKNVDNTFTQLAEMILDKIKSGELDPVNQINCGVKIGTKKNQIDYQKINTRVTKKNPDSCCS
jgi:GTPase SAR1 family protein